ncbi:integral membrane protein YggT, involved in response to extracytoplasmic stress (osmotic shock) [Helicobacter bizzozeronii CIII-1]|uniref:Integral membrane protein YggT, involved in response to extracytoplasmic stress (Osmotic shock) n=1 Tax=Helicobacter bizzozeronii (strain CIII-1) TaxID=1002804 RepID=F8KRV5_HELBC|nr:YggT family protein [Helicobacter bizzozeronii]CCB79501.1 integral membrane protein YggT, involved in response to extracytoplasmic stress (osmotic shock) [Helicobacter bizzozeronii CIII-1]
MITSTILGALATILHSLINLYMWIVIIASVLSFIRPDPSNVIVQMLYRLTEPLFQKIRQLMPFVVFNGIDLSPLAVVIFLQFTNMTLVQLLFAYSRG